MKRYQAGALLGLLDTKGTSFVYQGKSGFLQRYPFLSEWVIYPAGMVYLLCKYTIRHNRISYRVSDISLHIFSCRFNSTSEFCVGIFFAASWQRDAGSISVSSRKIYALKHRVKAYLAPGGRKQSGSPCARSKRFTPILPLAFRTEFYLYSAFQSDAGADLFRVRRMFYPCGLVWADVICDFLDS